MSRLLLTACAVVAFAGWVAGAETASASPAQRQRASALAPSEIRQGPIIFEGQIVHRAVDGSWLRLKLRSERGSFLYRVTPLAPETGRTDSPVEPRTDVAAGVVVARTRAWSDLHAMGADSWLELEGDITKVDPEKGDLEGWFQFVGGASALRLVLIENIPAGSDPSPTYRSVRYGPHERQTLDVYRAAATGVTPVAVFIHGGAWKRGDKGDLAGFSELLDAGISVVAINYRYCPPSNPDAATPAVAIPMQDAARALQFIRSQAIAWQLNKEKIGVWGVSAGACSALWLATHPDQSDPHSTNIVARESTRPICVAAIFPQTSLDPVEMRSWVGPEISYGMHAFAIPGDFDAFVAARPKLINWIGSYSPSAQLSADDGPMFLDYRDFTLTPSEPLNAYYTHSPGFGHGFQAKAKRLGIECRLRYAGNEDDHYLDWKHFLIVKLTGQAPAQQSRMALSSRR